MSAPAVDAKGEAMADSFRRASAARLLNTKIEHLLVEHLTWENPTTQEEVDALEQLEGTLREAYYRVNGLAESAEIPSEDEVEEEVA